MPIYAYLCESCGHRQDVLQKLSDPLLSTCPACQAETFVKQVTAAGFQLKGSGWYQTDFRNNGSAAPAPAAAGTPQTDKPASGEAAAPAAAPAPAPAAAPPASGGSPSTPAA